MPLLEIPSRGVTYRPGDFVNTDDFVYLLEEAGGAQQLAQFLAVLRASEAASLVAQTTLSLLALRRDRPELQYQLSRALLAQFRQENRQRRRGPARR